jgi:hypothetical protein
VTNRGSKKHAEIIATPVNELYLVTLLKDRHNALDEIQALEYSCAIFLGRNSHAISPSGSAERAAESREEAFLQTLRLKQKNCVSRMKPCSILALVVLCSLPKQWAL